MAFTSCAPLEELAGSLAGPKWSADFSVYKIRAIQTADAALLTAGVYVRSAFNYFRSWPTLVGVCVTAIFLSAIFGILACHLFCLYHRDVWREHKRRQLMYGYYFGSGTRRVNAAYRLANEHLWDRAWLEVSLAGLAHRLGNYSSPSNMLMFFLSWAYIPLAFAGLAEMILRVVLGGLWLLFFYSAHRICLLLMKGLSYLALPLICLADRSLRPNQFCPQCFAAFRLPAFMCPKCGRLHRQLTPGICGFFRARCICDATFLPCSALTGRSRLAAACPVCEEPLTSANSKRLAVQLIGGSNAGKTAFLAAFQHLYFQATSNIPGLVAYGEPAGDFGSLEEMFQNGTCKATSGARSQPYIFAHSQGRSKKFDLVIYDIPGEIIANGTYAGNPTNFRSCGGLIIMFDPLSVPSVRDDCDQAGEKEAVENYSREDLAAVIEEFISQFRQIRGSATGTVSDIPVAVIISKADIKVVKREVGGPKIKALYNLDPAAYGNSESTARDAICKDYLVKLGLGGELNNIDAAFSNVHYFPVSAMGHLAGEKKSYAPVGVLEPMQWLLNKAKIRIPHALA